MPRNDDELRKLIEQEAAKRRERLAGALENGGLPTEAEAKEAWNGLNGAFDTIEALMWRIEPIAESGELGDELPFEVTLEHVGILAMLADDIEGRADNFREFTRKVRGSMDKLLATRTMQQFDAERRA